MSTHRCIVGVATGPFAVGQDRFRHNKFVVDDDSDFIAWNGCVPPGSPSHFDMPYAFKAWAIKFAVEAGYTSILWADASILPIRPILPLWDRIEKEGYWVSRNGWTNAEWTADSAYPFLGVTKEWNEQIPHVVATSFGIDVSHSIGGNIYLEYLHLAQNGSFRGPWFNRNHPDYSTYAPSSRVGFCGGEKVRGHRHDQTALSVIAHKLGCKLTDPPSIFAYAGGEVEDTILLAQGNYSVTV